MSKTPLPKDARGIFQKGGAWAVKTAVMDLEPITATADFTKGTPEAFLIIRAGLNAGIAEARDFVESLLTEGGASVIYGPSNCGKSFWILDLAVSVATGPDFRDELEVDRGEVGYVAFEGTFGVRNRIEALKQAGRLLDDTPLFLCDAQVSLLERGHAAKLAESVKQAAEESQLPCRLVILDTLARAMAGGDENSGQDIFGTILELWDKIVQIPTFLYTRDSGICPQSPNVNNFEHFLVSAPSTRIMENIEKPPTPPADSRHHRFANLVFHGSNYADAYQEAGFKCTRATAYVNGHRLSRKADVANYLSEIRRLEFEEQTERTRLLHASFAADRRASIEEMLRKLRC